MMDKWEQVAWGCVKAGFVSKEAAEDALAAALRQCEATTTAARPEA